MKNLVLALAIVIASASGANAFIDNQYMTTAQYLQNTGYSAEMARLISITNQDPYREPYTPEHGFKNFIKRSYNYLLPGANTDMDFYNHNIHIDNSSWKDF